MKEARLAVLSCGPLVSYQDGGRFGMARFGVPASGPMDRWAHAAANVALGRPEGATAIEVSLGGITLECQSGEVSCCLAGGDFLLTHGDAVCRSWCVRTLRAGDRLSVRPGRWGSWAYLAFAGELVCTHWAGHSATHSTSGLGGGALRSGSTLVLGNPLVLTDGDGDMPVPDLARPRGVVQVVMGPQTGHFTPEALAAFESLPFAITPAFDRMGMRLAGPPLPLRDALSIPSEPIVRGSIQVAGDGVATILMADHQTAGGYPKIATVLSSETDAVAQLRPGDTVAFRALSAEQAIAMTRSHAALRRAHLETLKRPRGSVQERLMRENLISGVVCEGGRPVPG